jgi:hypothetical protein
MSKLAAGMDHQIAKHDFDPAQFEANVRRYSPSRTSKKGGERLARSKCDERYTPRAAAADNA